jgi:hypothetical protein
VSTLRRRNRNLRPTLRMLEPLDHLGQLPHDDPRVIDRLACAAGV